MDLDSRFTYISVIFLIVLGVLSLLTMICAITLWSSYNDNPIYFKRNDTILNKYNYDYVINQTFLTGIEFGNYSSDYNSYGYTGEPVRKCYIGSCYTKRDQTSINCSETCAISGSTCEAYNQKCTYIYCKKMENGYENDTVCHNYNEINFWRGQKMKLTKENIFFKQISDVVTENETCKQGYKQCGYINKEKDKLCVNDYQNCPINKVIIRDENMPPTDFDYETRKIGDKYLFYTNQNINNFMYINIIVDSGINSTNYTEIIDNQSLTDFFNENPYIYDGNYTSKSPEELSKYDDAKLKMCENINETTLKELRELQDKYTERLTIFSKEKLDEMNETAPRYLDLLYIFNITGFIYLLVIPMILHCCIYCWYKFDVCGEAKSALVIYLLLIPFFFFNTYSFVLVIKNKILYGQYYSMKYINDFIHCDNVWTYHEESCGEDSCTPAYWSCENVCFFNDLKYYNNALFICYIIEYVLLILHIGFTDFRYGGDFALHIRNKS